MTSLSDHTFGVNCVAFSPDSRYLASLGSANDGFLYVWSINPRTGAATLHASNKCVSNINRITWMGNRLITVGTRHVKVWKVEESNSTLRIAKSRQSDLSFISSAMHKTLPGRNCILEGLKDTTFTSVVTVAPNKAIAASDKGDICLVEDSGLEQRFSKVADAGFTVSSMAVDINGRLHLAGNQGGLKTLNIRDIIGTLTPPPSPPPRVESPAAPVTNSSHIGAIACLNDCIITVDSQRAIRLSQISQSDDDLTIGDLVHTLPAHGDAVLGVHAGLNQPNHLDAAYYTWAADGTIIFWNQSAFKGSVQVPLEQLEGPDASVNELKTARVSADGCFVAAGDKLGVLRVIDCRSNKTVFESKAHASEITSLAIHEEEHVTFLACASRDRTVQVFIRTDETWELLQTLDEHVGAVNGVLFSQNGTRLVSSSSDRSLVVRELVSREDHGKTIRAFVMLRAIMLKASPVSMAWDIEQADSILLSTIDRHVHKYDTQSGHCQSSFRACDTDGGDTVVLSSLVHIPRGWSSPLIAGVSSTDKSIRVYDENGSLIARDWGHTEGVSDIALVQTTGDSESSEKSIVTVAVDGTIFVWGLALQAPSRQDLSKSMDLLGPSTPSNQDLLSNRPPLRRVFSQSELARFQRPPEDGNATPTGNRSPRLRKKLSKFTFAPPTPKLEPSPMPSSSREGRTPAWQGQGSLRSRNKNRSPSPPSPRNPQLGKRRASMDVRTRTKAPVNEFGSIGASTESLCRTLRSYRKRLANSTDTLSSELAKEVERELAATARAIGDRVKTKEFEENIMVKLLDQYSERLVNMLDEKIAASVAQRVRENSVSNFSEGLESPGIEQDTRRDRHGSDGTISPAKEESIDESLVLETTEKLTIE